VIYVVYTLTINLQFHVFERNFLEISKLLKECQTNRNFNRFFKAYSAVILTTLALVVLESFTNSTNQVWSHHRYFFDPTSNLFLLISVNISINLTLFTCYCCHTLMLCCFLKSCLQFGWIYKELVAKFQDFELEKSVDKQKKSIKTFVNAHIEAMEKVKELSKNFNTILSLEIVFLTVTMSMVLIVVASHQNLLEQIIDVSFMAFSLFLFCYSSEIVRAQVRFPTISSEKIQQFQLFNSFNRMQKHSTQSTA
jgi:hypothetical protein